MGEDITVDSEATTQKTLGNFAVVAYVVGIFALAPVGYYATLATFGVPSGGMTSALLVWLLFLSIPGFLRHAIKPVAFWQVALLAELLPLLEYVFPVGKVTDPEMRLTKLAIEAALTPFMAWHGFRIGGYFVKSETRAIQPEAPRNLIHRIRPEPQPEDVVNVSQK